MKLWIRTLLLVIVSVVALQGCSLLTTLFSTSKIKSKNYYIKFNPGASGNRLGVVTGNKGCKANPHNGCMFFPENTIGIIKFWVPGGKFSSKTCQQGAKWVITKVQLTTSGNASKGNFTVFPLDPWIETDAFADVNRNTGFMPVRDVSVATNQYWLTNLNGNDPQLGDKTFWYKVTAEDCDNIGTTRTSDPRGVNGGTK